MRNYTRKDIRKIAKKIYKKYHTTNPFELCDILGVYIDYYDMPTSFLGYQVKIYRTSNVTLNLKNDSFINQYTLCHELGHHVLRHDINNGLLNTFVKRHMANKIEFEANCFMVELLGCKPDIEFNTEDEYLTACGIPFWARKYVDWEYVKGSRNIG